MKARAVQLIAHNNHAERPFAVIKLFDYCFPSMSFGNKAGLSHARCNGTFKIPEPTKKKVASTAPKLGATIAADPSLQRAVSRVCNVRRRKIDGRMVPAGVVSRLVREHRAADGADSAEMRKKKTAKKFELNKQRAIRMAQKKDAAFEVDVVESEARLDDLLKGKSGKKTMLGFLSKQYDARIVGRSYSYSMEAIPVKYRGKNKDGKTGVKKLRKSPESGDEVAYLTSLVKLMIKEDIRLARYGAGAAAATDDRSDKTLARQLPVISEEFTSSTSMELKGKERDEAASLLNIEDDAYLTELTEKYIDQVFYDEEFDATYKVLDVQYDERGETSYYEATSVQLERGEDGWEISGTALVGSDSDVIKDTKLVGYALVNLTDPENIEIYDDVDKMITAHKEREAKQAETAADEYVASEEEGGAKSRKRGRRA
mgnify:CR=1 FL=1